MKERRKIRVKFAKNHLQHCIKSKGIRREEFVLVCTYINNVNKNFQFEKVSAVKCKVCNDLFIELSDLKRHQALVHERDYKPLKAEEDYLKF